MSTPKHISIFSAVFPPAPPFTATSLPSLKGRVIIITGGASGMGFEFAKIVYLAGATVFIAARSSARCEEAIARVLEQTKVMEGKKGAGDGGKLQSLVVDLADLGSVKKAAERFLEQEERLDLLVHNAGLMTPPANSKSVQGHDIEMGVNCLAPFLLTQLLSPLLTRTASLPTTPKNSVRVVFVVSLLQGAAPPGGMVFDKSGLKPVVLEKAMLNYMQSKVGGAWLAVEFAKRLGGKGVLCVSLHPGLMRTELQRNWPLPAKLILGLFFKPPVYGAYSELYASFSPDITSADNGGYLMAWGRKGILPEHIKNEMKNGDGAMGKFVGFCECEVEAFL